MSAPDDYTLSENLQTVLSNTLKAPHWNTASDSHVPGQVTLSAALAVPEVAALVEAAYLAGFNASCEGYNGEYPFGDKSRDPMQDAAWLEIRNSALAALKP